VGMRAKEKEMRILEECRRNFVIHVTFLLTDMYVA